ncbi:hypothetical protein [Thermococcus sp. AM4]|uniref:hypothetical protein n=1 Tax=Thermococcus sp. (strain AM4) TaxID=246969 RepID=UPI00022998D2|nr:conserved hypothetical protein [Thermococcus sp. AM4]
MKKVLVALLLILLLSFFAYNAYTYHQLSSAEGAYKLAGISGDEKLIAVYHDAHFWQFATYNPKTNTLKLYTVEQSSIFWLKSITMESAKALVNYTPLALDLNQLKRYKPHSKALLFKTLGWKYDYQINGSYWANLSEIIRPGEKYYRIYGLGSSSGLWIKSKAVCRKTTLEAVCYGTVGTNGILVIPGFKDSKMLWVVEGVKGNPQVAFFYPGVVLKTVTEENKVFTYSSEDGDVIESIVQKLEGKNPFYLEVWFSRKAKCPGYGQILANRGTFCELYACYNDNSTNIELENISCIPNLELRNG